MAKGDFYFPVFYQRLLTSTSGWKDDEFGCYFRLLIHQFDKGSIPDDINKLARIAPSVKKHWEHLLKEKFVSDGQGALINEVMDEIRKNIQHKKDNSRVNGKNGGRPPKPKSGEIRLYLIECYCEEERFYKAGITQETIKERFNTSERGGSIAMPYSFKIIIDQIVELRLGLDIENHLQVNCELYTPKKKFSGHTECFTKSPKVIEFITHLVTQKNPVGFKNETQIKAIPITINQYPKEERVSPPVFYSVEQCLEIALKDDRWIKANKTNRAELQQWNTLMERRGIYEKNPADYKQHFANWKLSGKNEDLLVPESSSKNGQDFRTKQGEELLNSIYGPDAKK